MESAAPVKLMAQGRELVILCSHHREKDMSHVCRKFSSV